MYVFSMSQGLIERPGLVGEFIKQQKSTVIALLWACASA